jgi:hypothetical protein
MRDILKKVKNLTGKNCITIILNTHRTKPEYQKDEIQLKNKVNEVKKRLTDEMDKREFLYLATKLEKLAETIDHSHNLESLILFVNQDIAEFVRLPLRVKERVVIGDTFATRDLVRSLNYETGYFVLVLSQQKIRLIEALNDKAVQEYGDPFPFENKKLYSMSKAEEANARRQTNLVAEFFNRCDKELNKIRKNKPLPVLICSEESNFYEYMKIADEKGIFYGTYLNKNRINEKSPLIIKDAWETVRESAAEQKKKRKEELFQAAGAGKILSDINEIWLGIHEGRVQTLFVEEGLYQQARIENNRVVVKENDEMGGNGIIDDIYDEMIEANMRFGGDVVFLPPGELSEFQGCGAILRY